MALTDDQTETITVGALWCFYAPPRRFLARRSA